jgi:hypothetical protein
MVSGHVATTNPQLVQKCFRTAGTLLRAAQLLLPLLLLVALHLGLQNRTGHIGKVTVREHGPDDISLQQIKAT